MSETNFNVTLTEITGYDWEAVLVGAEHPTCRDYHFRLFKKASELAEAGDETGQRVFRFLGAVASLSLSSDDTETPFSPLAIMGSRRSLALEDLGPADLGVISELLPTTRDPSMRARFGDILWVARKDYKAAKVAAESYLESFTRLDPEKDWMFDIEGLRRGFGLARLFGKENEPFLSYLKYSEGLLDARANSETDALSARLIELLLEHEVGDCLRHAAATVQIAKRIESSGSHSPAQRYLELATRLYLAGKDEEGARRVQLEKGQSLVRHAQRVAANPGQGYSTGTHFLAMGVECLRQAKASDEVVAKLHKQLREWQEAALNEMQTLKHEVDISDVVKAARDFVRGKSLLDAVLAFALGAGPATRAKLRERVLESADKFPLSHLMGATFLSHDGRVLAHKPPVIGVGKDADEEGVQAEIFFQARSIDWPFRFRAYIEPCRIQIYQEHRPSMEDLSFLVEHNPLIPPGHEAIFLRGMHAGFRGDMVVCAHLLVPQIEESIRYVLQRSGVVTSKLDSKLVQEERLLGVLLAMPETLAIFGEGLVFELRGVLCERFGFDLRNRLAHGFLSANECFGADVFMAWWLVLRLCAFPVYRELKSQSPPPPSARPDAEADKPQQERSASW